MAKESHVLMKPEFHYSAFVFLTWLAHVCIPFSFICHLNVLFICFHLHCLTNSIIREEPYANHFPWCKRIYDSEGSCMLSMAHKRHDVYMRHSHYISVPTFMIYIGYLNTHLCIILNFMELCSNR